MAFGCPLFGDRPLVIVLWESGYGNAGKPRSRAYLDGDKVYFHQRILRETRHLHGRASGGWAIVRLKIFRIDCIHGAKMSHVFQENSRLYNPGKIQACSRENGLQVFRTRCV